ncbi:MAG: LysR family transcriptional regulator [Myxococcota bacterium]
MAELPSLDTLRALEAAARLESYSAAAREMSLTHGAVSHRIRALEVALDQKLFERDGNAMRPTAEGRRLAEQAHRVLDILQTTFGASRSTNEALNVSVVPALATLCLASQMSEFERLHPRFPVRLRPNFETVRPGSSGTHLALRYGRGPWAGTEVRSGTG